DTLRSEALIDVRQTDYTTLAEIFGRNNGIITRFDKYLTIGFVFIKGASVSSLRQEIEGNSFGNEVLLCYFPLTFRNRILVPLWITALIDRIVQYADER